MALTFIDGMAPRSALPVSHAPWQCNWTARDHKVAPGHKIVDPDSLQVELRGDGDEPCTIFIQRFDEKVRALICREL